MSATEAAPSRREAQPRRRALVALVAAAVVATLVAAWLGGAAWQHNQVEVAWAGPVTCTGTGAELVSDARDDISTTVVVRPGMRCELSVRVANDGWLPVSLGTATFAYMGPAGGAVVDVRTTDQVTPRPQGGDGYPAIDAVLDLDEPLESGSDRVLTFVLTHRPGGCQGAAGVMTLDDVPTVAVRALGRTGLRTGTGELGLEYEGPSVCDS